MQCQLIVLPKAVLPRKDHKEHRHNAERVHSGGLKHIRSRAHLSQSLRSLKRSWKRKLGMEWTLKLALGWKLEMECWI